MDKVDHVAIADFVDVLHEGPSGFGEFGFIIDYDDLRAGPAHAITDDAKLGIAEGDRVFVLPLQDEVETRLPFIVFDLDDGLWLRFGLGLWCRFFFWLGFGFLLGLSLNGGSLFFLLFLRKRRDGVIFLRGRGFGNGDFDFGRDRDLFHKALRQKLFDGAKLLLIARDQIFAIGGFGDKGNILGFEFRFDEFVAALVLFLQFVVAHFFIIPINANSFELTN